MGVYFKAQNSQFGKFPKGRAKTTGDKNIFTEQQNCHLAS